MDDAHYTPARGELRERGPNARGRAGSETGARTRCCFFDLAWGTRQWTAVMGHETTQPLVNHLGSVSGSISYILRRARLSDEPVAVQLLDPMNHQTQTEQRGFDWQKLGLFRLLDWQSLQSCRSAIVRAYASERQEEEHRPWPSRS